MAKRVKSKKLNRAKTYVFIDSQNLNLGTSKVFLIRDRDKVGRK